MTAAARLQQFRNPLHRLDDVWLQITLGASMGHQAEPQAGEGRQRHAAGRAAHGFQQ
jgi:hypothetical protein